MATDAFDRVHPDLMDLIIRLDLLPIGEAGLTEANLARICYLAIELADPDEQALLVSRIIPEEELAFERLRSPEVQNVSHRVVLDRAERKAALEGDKHEYIPSSEYLPECLICTEASHVKAPCGCNYCLPCFRIAIRRGLRSQEDFPPRCCKPFDEAVVTLARSPALIHLFRQMQEEAETPIHDRLYCHDGNCAAFIPPGCKGACLLCNRKTCVECFEMSHPGRPCEQGDAEEDVWATMDKNKTVNCPGCGRMVELMEACNHMTCVCGKQFCYLCGKSWSSSCGCPPYGHLEQMVPMKDRPGVKPPQFRRRRQRRTEESASENTPLRIPQLRSQGGDEDRVPTVTVTRSKVIRPLALPQQNDRQHERERQQRRRQREPIPEFVPPPLRVRERRGLHGRRNAVDLLQGERFVVQPEPREANRPNDAPRHHHRQQQETQLIPVGFPVPLPGMPLVPGTHRPIPPGLNIPVRFAPPGLMSVAPGLMPAPLGLSVPRRMVDRADMFLLNNFRHQQDNMFNNGHAGREEDLHRIQVEQEPQRQPPVQNQGQAAREQQLDPVAATEQLRQLNLATQQRIDDGDAQDAQNQQSGQQTDVGDSRQPQEYAQMSYLHRVFLRHRG